MGDPRFEEASIAIEQRLCDRPPLLVNVQLDWSAEGPHSACDGSVVEGDAGVGFLWGAERGEMGAGSLNGLSAQQPLRERQRVV